MTSREQLRATARDGGSVDVAGAIIDHLDLWTGAVTKKSSSGRGSNGKVELTGIKKLRELILELAVRGKLVEQYANDEPASMLLEKIDKDKAQLTQLGKLKKPKKYPQIAPEEHPFKIPSSWIWERMHRVFLKITDGTHHSPPNKEDGDFLYVSAKNIKPEGVQLDGITYVTKGIHEEIYTRCNPELGDLLYIKDGATTGVATINNLDEAFSMLSSVALLKPHRDLLSNKFLLYCLRAPFFYQEMRAGMTGVAITRVTLKKLDLALIPVPPIEEQHRIVQKVDELMALCDRLEQQTSDQLEAHETLVDTLLGTLTQSENATELADNWARIKDHFDTLFTTEQSIDKLKQTILQLAVMGRLTHQDPNEEPASILLDKIANEMCQLTANKRTKKTSTLPSISDEELPFEKPLGWEAARLHNLIAISSGDGLTAAKMNNDGGIPVFGGNGVNGFHDKANVKEPTLVIGRVGYYCGSIHITPEEAWVTDNAFITRYAREHLSQRYLYWLLKATNLKEQDNATAQPVISGRKIYPIVVIIAPRLEQDRISEKIDELMALCDQLKERLNQASETRNQLAEAVAEGALN